MTCYMPLPPAATRPCWLRALTRLTRARCAPSPVRTAPQARKELHADVERSGFNYSGAIRRATSTRAPMYSLLLTVHLAVYLPPNCLLTTYSVGNVIDLAPLGLAVHNVEWETEAALAFLRLGALHVKQGRAAAFYLHLCTTLTHSPGPRAGVCSDPRLSAAGLSAAAPAVQPTRASVMARTGADGGGGDRYTAAGADRWRCDALDPNPDPDPDPDPNPTQLYKDIGLPMDAMGGAPGP